MKKNIVLILIILIVSGCSEILDKTPNDQPSDETFFSNEKELLLGINAAYRDIGQEVGILSDAISDIGWIRTGGRGDVYELLIGIQNTESSSMITNYWRISYTGISKCNLLLDKMHRAEEVVNETLYNRIKAEARFLRSFYYFQLTNLYGDVPLIKTPQALSDAMVSNTPKSETVDYILQELTECALDLPESYNDDNIGRATKGAALALKARVALYNEKWDIAAKAAQDVMNLNQYQLYPDFRKLFMNEGQSNEEVIFEIQYLSGQKTHGFFRDYVSRNLSGLSMFAPNQSLVDSYECTDGLTIDISPLYDKADPFLNRDPRLDKTVLRDGTIFGGIVYSTNPNDVTTLNVKTGNMIPNEDVKNVYRSMTGYLWLKYGDEENLAEIRQCPLNIILYRYAEILLIYAEAKIELNQIDNSVLNAINQVRARAYSTTVENISDYPSVTTTNVNELRKIVRRERKVEFANEGLRIFDIKRWGIFEKAMNGMIYGRPAGDFEIMGIPVFDENGIPDYSAYADKMQKTYTRNHTITGYLWPIPQREMDANSNLKQNSGY
jgi:starch-binding outer membrane protein, SusD/RagB family